MARVRGTVAVIAAVALSMGALVVASPSASAHDPDCLVALHVGPVKQHVVCEGNDDDGEICVLSFNFMFVHEDVLCEDN